MRIVDEDGNTINTPDYSRGYVVEDVLLLAHHEPVMGSKEKGHYETIRSYPNGGKEVRYIVDEPAVEERAAWDEYENVLRFVEYSEQDLIERRITELKKFLLETDYQILKVVEGVSTLKDCTEIIAKRAAWRKEINDLEDERLKLISISKEEENGEII